MEENIQLGTLDYDSLNDLENMRSVTAYSVYLNGLPVAIKSQMQDAVTFSLLEGELMAAKQCYQEMFNAHKVCLK
jgi:hypothetical protein